MEQKVKHSKKNSVIFPKSKEICLMAKSSEETEKIGEIIAGWIKKHNINCLIFTGPFGSGKTTIIKGIIRKLTGKSNITSPSFTIVNQYSTNKISIFHFDFYRIKNQEELESFGFSEYIEKGILLIEWPEAAIKKVPQNSLKISMEFSGLKQRKITISPP